MAAQERDDAESTEGGAEGAARQAAGDETAPGQSRPDDQSPPDRSPERSPADLPPPDRSPDDQAGPDEGETAPIEPAGPGQAPAGPAPVGPSGTSVMPPVAGGPPEPPRWAARAQVPTPRVEEYGDEWVSEPPRSVLFPVLITVCVLLLLGIAGFGVWLALDNRPGPGPTTPSGTTSASATTPVTTTPTTSTSTPSPTASGVEVPVLIGEEYDDAEERLTDLGLVPERVDIFHATVAEGEVIGTDPTAGSRLAAGASIKVFVSRGPEPTNSPSASPSPSASATT